MPKAYWVGRVTVHDEEGYKKYLSANAEPFATYGAKFLVRGGPFEQVEGQGRDRNIVIEFPTLEAARACYQSPEYQTAKAFRTATSDGEIIIIEGYDGPQPGEV